MSNLLKPNPYCPAWIIPGGIIIKRDGQYLFRDELGSQWIEITAEDFEALQNLSDFE